MNESFKSELEPYVAIQNGIHLGAAMLGNDSYADCPINIPLKTLNRHGLIAGATGTGKTKTLQGLAERLSNQGVPVLLMDIKGDLSGLGAKGDPSPRVQERQKLIGTEFLPQSFPVEFLTLSEQKGVQLRATVSEFGPILFSQILDLNDTQSGIVAILFQYCDDHNLPLLDLKDVKKTLNYLINSKDKDIIENYGKFSPQSLNSILRKITELEQQGADIFFSEPSFDIMDLMRTQNGLGVISVLNLTDLQSKPKLFSCFMLCMLAEVFATLDEVGDQEKPKLVIFIDEAHLIFNQASKPLLEQLDMVIKLIRSKGVGIIFCTQSPTDIPENILGQLGLKIQHALRAFSAKDRKNIKLAAQNYPESEFYDTKTLITELGIGEALITALSDKGRPMPLVKGLLNAPSSRMAPLTNAEYDAIVQSSSLTGKYNTRIDRESAYEMLSKKLEQSAAEPSSKKSPIATKTKSSRILKQVGNIVIREVTRSLLGVLGIGGRRRR